MDCRAAVTMLREMGFMMNWETRFGAVTSSWLIRGQAMLPGGAPLPTSLKMWPEFAYIVHFYMWTFKSLVFILILPKCKIKSSWFDCVKEHTNLPKGVWGRIYICINRPTHAHLQMHINRYFFSVTGSHHAHTCGRASRWLPRGWQAGDSTHSEAAASWDHLQKAV